MNHKARIRRIARINYDRFCTTTLTSQKEWLSKPRTELKSERN